MNNRKGDAGILVVAVIALLVAFGSFFYVATHISAPAAPSQTAGSISGPDISSPYLNVAGVTHWYSHVVMRQASTTLCSIPTPAATSTITKATFNLVSGNAYSNVFAIGIGASAYATTTLIGSPFTISAAYGSIIATSSLSTQTSGDNIVYPHQFVNFNISTSSASATYAPIGDCQVDFTQL